MVQKKKWIKAYNQNKIWILKNLFCNEDMFDPRAFSLFYSLGDGTAIAIRLVNGIEIAHVESSIKEYKSKDIYNELSNEDYCELMEYCKENNIDFSARYEKTFFFRNNEI